MKFIHYLEGHWCLSRKITGSHSASVKGIAFFMPMTQLDALHYSEDVQIVLNRGITIKGYQNYIYRCENDLLNVYFRDGKRLFHSIDAKLQYNKKYTASHSCLLDTYIISYFFMENFFEIEYRANGPKKSYISHSQYIRLAKEPST